METRTLNTQQITTRDGQTQIANIYNMSVNIYTLAGSIIVEPSCAGFMFTNLGDMPAFINGMRINPFATPNPLNKLGDSRSILLHKLDIYKGFITLAFDNSIGTNPKVEIVQTYYAEAYNRV